MIRVTRRTGPSTAVSGGLFAALCYVVLVWPFVQMVKLVVLVGWAYWAAAKQTVALVQWLTRRPRRGRRT